ncbi:MAG: hypothetical protein PUG67_06540 [Peptoniphilaceae bacterium]|nr:hypothetical protein [Peptoniphilaceae bacterium]MDY6019678.1 hypothetical protein [Anaerococcus sp.]
MTDKIKLKDLSWTGNSKKMFDEIMDNLPTMYRAAVKKKFEVWCNQKQVTEISEYNIIHTLEKYAPKKIQEKFMPIYQKYKSEEN